jgi:hypothetical protein
MASNYHFDMTGAPLDAALAIAFGTVPGGKAVGWMELPTDPDSESVAAVWGAQPAPLRLVLFWHAGQEPVTLFEKPLDADGVEPFVRWWLQQVRYGPEPHHDGSNKRSHRVYNEVWNMVAGVHYAFAAIEPAWLQYGK